MRPRRPYGCEPLNKWRANVQVLDDRGPNGDLAGNIPRTGTDEGPLRRAHPGPRPRRLRQGRVRGVRARGAVGVGPAADQGIALPPYTPVLESERKLRCQECDPKGKVLVSVHWGAG
jgi:hypothetical protein